MRISNLSCRQLYTRPECMGRFYTEDFRVYTGSLRELLPSILWISLYAESLKRSIVSRPIDFSLFWCVLSPVHTGDKVEFNTVDLVESRLLPKPATNRQQSRLLQGNVQLCCRFWQQIVDNVNTTACRGRLCCQYGRLRRQCVPGFREWFLLVLSRQLLGYW